MKRILLVTSVLPWPLRRNGGGQRSALLRRALSRWGEVEILAIGGDQLVDDGVTAEGLRTHGVVATFRRNPHHELPPPLMRGPLRGLHEVLDEYRARYRPDPAAAVWLRECAGHRPYDLIVGRYLGAALQAGVQDLPDVPRLLDFDDIDWQAFDAQLARQPWPGVRGKIGAAIVGREVRRIGRDALRHFGHVWVTSDEDAGLLPGISRSVLPNISFSEEDRSEAATSLASPDRSESNEVLFIGDLQHVPNREGLSHFLPHVWPAIRREAPGATLRIVGRGLTDAMRKAWSGIDGVEVVGFAADLAACYARAAFSVVPVYFGGGTKIKVLEALTHGRTCVATPHALRGYAKLTEGEPAVGIGANDASFAAMCVHLLKTPSLRRDMAERGARVVAEHFSFARFQQVVDAAVEPLLEGRGIASAARTAAHRPGDEDEDALATGVAP